MASSTKSDPARRTQRALARLTGNKPEDVQLYNEVWYVRHKGAMVRVGPELLDQASRLPAKRWGGTTAPTSKGADRVSPRPRGDTKNTEDPRGQFGLFLRWWFDTHSSETEKSLAAKLDKSERTIRKWKEGSHGPAFEDLDNIAKLLGYSDWSKLAAAIIRKSSET